MSDPDITKAPPKRMGHVWLEYVFGENGLGHTSCPSGDTRENGCEEDGDEEANSRDHCCDTRLASLTNTRRALNESSYGRGSCIQGIHT